MKQGGYIMAKLIMLGLCVLISASAYAAPWDTSQIENLIGEKGEFDRKSGTFKVSVPCQNLKVRAHGIELTPSLGLTSWVSFKQTGLEVELIGNMVLLEDQVDSVMAEALEKGLKIIGLHNCYLWDAPKLMLMHFKGKGDVKDLANAVGKVFETIKKTSSGSIWNLSPPPLKASNSNPDPRSIEALLDTKGTLKDGVYKLVWNLLPSPDCMGINTWAGFIGTNKQAALLGEFAVTEDKAQNVLKALLKHHISITSLHQYQIEIGEQTHITLISYIGRGSTLDLAKSLKEALEQCQFPSEEKKERNSVSARSQD